ncbi:AzlC family ABC transporter permease [Agrobacterium pusense]|uniref:AzlC family ABC transporter permease n=1 Tax=Agrobacterium pusense TaxID=648995 RepID=A0A6H0ZFR8_9HYPH|nr:AzlC family ABC transporter permease [Agrobacterium pusense]QIX19698.1 AzlC family ABC transporter permease [Agrobacterium pusense]WCK27669.1 AzlC family ABC transporter permease [Agrobacterium pusense]
MSNSEPLELEIGMASGHLIRGLKDAVPVMLGFVPFALVLGAQAVQKGFSPVEVSLMTGLNFGGGSEFAALALWTSPPHVALIVAITLLVNSRHLLMGAALAPLMRGLSRRKAFLVLFLMCDESWAMGLDDARRNRTSLNTGYFFGVAIGLYLSWIVFTTVGAVVGPVVGDVTRYGFDMAFPAVFLFILAGMWKGVAASRPWLVSLVVAGATHIFVPGAWYVPAGALSGVLSAYLLARPK